MLIEQKAVEQMTESLVDTSNVSFGNRKEGKATIPILNKRH